MRDAAELLGVSDDTVRRWIDDGALSAHQDDSGRKAIDGAELARFARDNAAGAPKDPLGYRQFGAQPVRRPGHRSRDRQRDGPGGNAVRPFHCGVTDEHPGGPRTRPAAGQHRRRRRQGHHGDRRNAERTVMTGWRSVALVGALSVSLIAGCGSGSNPSTRSEPSTTTAAQGGHLVVFAAASLEIDVHRHRRTVQDRQPRHDSGVLLRGFFGPGDPVDPGRARRRVRLRRHPQHGQGRAAGLLDGARSDFASNTLTIVVAPGNPKDVTSSGPDETGPQRRHLRPAGPVRRRHLEGRGGYRCDAVAR